MLGGMIVSKLRHSSQNINIMTDLLFDINNSNVKSNAWVNKDPTNRFVEISVMDKDHWNVCNIHTIEDFDRYHNECAYNDMHKDVYGIYSSHYRMSSMSNKELKIATEQLYNIIIDDILYSIAVAEYYNNLQD